MQARYWGQEEAEEVLSNRGCGPPEDDKEEIGKPTKVVQKWRLANPK